jgi:hypothetical protein
MIYTSVAVSYERKVNLGNYEHCTVSASLWAKVEEDEDVEGCMHMLFAHCKEVAAQQVPGNPKGAAVMVEIK